MQVKLCNLWFRYDIPGVIWAILACNNRSCHSYLRFSIYSNYCSCFSSISNFGQRNKKRAIWKFKQREEDGLSQFRFVTFNPGSCWRPTCKRRGAQVIELSLLSISVFLVWIWSLSNWYLFYGLPYIPFAAFSFMGTYVYVLFHVLFWLVIYWVHLLCEALQEAIMNLGFCLISCISLSFVEILVCNLDCMMLLLYYIPSWDDLWILVLMIFIF